MDMFFFDCSPPPPGCVQVYFLPDPFLSPIPFVALKTGGRPLIQKACVAQASSLRTLYRARVRWDAICNTTKSPPEVVEQQH